MAHREDRRVVSFGVRIVVLEVCWARNTPLDSVPSRAVPA